MHPHVYDVLSKEVIVASGRGVDYSVDERGLVWEGVADVKVVLSTLLIYRTIRGMDIQSMNRVLAIRSVLRSSKQERSASSYELFYAGKTGKDPLDDVLMA
jgi:hypothetical protein